jgi:hypothetical protein
MKWLNHLRVEIPTETDEYWIWRALDFVITACQSQKFVSFKFVPDTSFAGAP